MCGGFSLRPEEFTDLRHSGAASTDDGRAGGGIPWLGCGPLGAGDRRVPGAFAVDDRAGDHRNGGRAPYRAAAADHRAYQRARRPKPAKLARNARLRALVEEKLTTCWSPEQIAGWLRRQFPGEESMRVSHEAIYLTLFDPRRKAINRTLTRKLRTRRPMRHPKRARRPTGAGVISDLVPISERPVEVETR
jgi:IS30 family transposase